MILCARSNREAVNSNQRLFQAELVVTAGPVGKKIEHTRHASDHARAASQRAICKKIVRLASFIFVPGEGGNTDYLIRTGHSARQAFELWNGKRPKRGDRPDLFNNGNELGRCSEIYFLFFIFFLETADSINPEWQNVWRWVRNAAVSRHEFRPTSLTRHARSNEGVTTKPWSGSRAAIGRREQGKRGSACAKLQAQPC
jgi:hypothetical protein